MAQSYDHPLTNVGKALLEAGKVERFHCTPHHQPYNVATHSWGMAALLRHLNPGASSDLIWAVLFHDVAERWTGDMPAPAKWWLSPDLKAVEAGILKELGLDFGLSPTERCWLHALDMLELFLYCMSELEMGNTLMNQARDACLSILLHEASIPAAVSEYARNYKRGRVDDCFGHG